jgi:glycerol kinase
LLEEDPDVQAALKNGGVRLGGTDSYVIHRLTGGDVHATDAATASRTALFNLRAVHWDQDLLAAFGLDPELLPEIRPTTGDFGLVRHPDIDAPGLRITADAVDAHAALFAQGCWDATSAKATYGTGAFIECNTGSEPIEPDGQLPVFIAWELESGIDYTVEGGVFSVGAAVDWAVRAGWLPSAEASAELAQSEADSGGVVMVPCLTGLSAPHWHSSARAAIFGLGLDSTPGHVARALLDGIACSCAEVIQALDRKLGGSLSSVKADGGPSRNRYLMQRQADLLDMPVAVSKEPDMTALGAAWLAGIGAKRLTLGDVRDQELDAIHYEPQMGSDQREAIWTDWRQAVRQVIERGAS